MININSIIWSTAEIYAYISRADGKSSEIELQNIIDLSKHLFGLNEKQQIDFYNAYQHIANLRKGDAYGDWLIGYYKSNIRKLENVMHNQQILLMQSFVDHAKLDGGIHSKQMKIIEVIMQELNIVFKHGIKLSDLINNTNKPDYINRTQSSSASKYKYEYICPYCSVYVGVNKYGLFSCPTCEKQVWYFKNKVSKTSESLPPAIELIVTLYAKIAKADGVVTEDEIRFVDNEMTDGISNIEFRKMASRVFNEAKKKVEDYELVISDLNLAKDFIKNETYNDLIDSCIELASIDGAISNDQEKIIRRLVTTFNSYTNKNYEDYFKGSNSKLSLDECYELFGCNKNSTIEEFKSAYKRLSKQYHPDVHDHNDAIPKHIKDLSVMHFVKIQEAYKILINSK